MRTKGSVNRPKYVNVRLSDLTRMFNSDTFIKVAAEYEELLNINSASVSPTECTVPIVEKQKIEIKMVDLKNRKIKT